LVKGGGSCDPRCLPSAGTLRRIRWPLQPRSQDRVTALADAVTLGWRSHAPLGLRRSSTVSLRSTPTRARFFARPDIRRFTAECRAALGPRSLPPLPLFGGLCGSVFEADAAYRLLQHAFRRAGLSPSSRVLAGTEAATSFLFLRVSAAFLAEAVTRGEPRDVHSNDPFAGSSCSRRFARHRYRSERATPRRVSPSEIVTTDVHGPLDRVKDASPSAGARWLG